MILLYSLKTRVHKVQCNIGWFCIDYDSGSHEILARRLEDTDKSFRIVLATEDTTRHLLSVIRNSEPSSGSTPTSIAGPTLIRSDLDVVERVEYRAPSQIHVATPSLDVQLFLPASDSPLMAGWKVDPNSSPVKIIWGTRCIDWRRARNMQFNSGSLRVDWRLFNDSLYESPVEWLFPAYLTILTWNRYEYKYALRGFCSGTRVDVCLHVEVFIILYSNTRTRIFIRSHIILVIYSHSSTSYWLTACGSGFHSTIADHSAVNKSQRQPQAKAKAGGAYSYEVVEREAPGAQVELPLPPIDTNAPLAQSILRAATGSC